MNDPLRDQLDRAGASVASDDTVLLYHATTVSGAERILSQKVLQPARNERYVFVSTSPAIASVMPDAEVVIAVRIRLGELVESRDWLEHDDALLRRADYALAVGEGGSYRPVAVGRWAYDAPD